MINLALFNMIVVAFAYLARHKSMDFLLKVSFFLIFLFLALRYDYGNDYPGYLNFFLRLNRWGITGNFDPSLHFEPGWVLLCRLFKPLGFFAMTAVLALFNCVVYYRFIKKYVPRSYYWFAVFLYVFNPSFMLIHSSAMRQSIAISLFIFSIDYICGKNFVRYFLCISIASLFHFSALLLMPAYLLGVYDFKIKRIKVLIVYSVFVSLFFLKDVLGPLLFSIIGLYFKKYEVYEGAIELGSGLGLIYTSIILLFILIFSNYRLREISILSKIVTIGYMVIPLGFVVAMISRVGMYLQPATIAILPIMLIGIKDKLLRIYVLVSLIVMTFYSFYIFYESDIWKVAFGTYRTIFSAPEIY